MPPFLLSYFMNEWIKSALILSAFKTDQMLSLAHHANKYGRWAEYKH